MDSTRIFTVSEINASIRGILESRFPFISIAGEISNLRRPVSGHLYFTLKDENAQIKAVLFKMQQRYLTEKPADGRQVICRGRISVYEPRGEYQLIVDAMDFHGAGLLQLEYEKLKKKLADEGLFDREKKKVLPEYPGHITVVTSPQGAAVHDFIRVAGARYPLAAISIYPVTVQGSRASAEIADALEDINNSVPTDIIVLCRGGGSIEDLWAFNEEKVARAIVVSDIPVVSAVGHETDFTIADLAADLRAPTPSSAAELVFPDKESLKKQVNTLQGRLRRLLTANLDTFEEKLILQRHKLASLNKYIDSMLMKLDHLAVRIEKATLAVMSGYQAKLDNAARLLQTNNPLYQLRFRQQEMQGLHRRLIMAAKRNIDDARDELSRLAGVLDAVSPLATLARGYSIVRRPSPKQEIISDYRDVAVQDRVEVTLHKGFIACTIEKTGESRSDINTKGKK